jgi:hypothetical protein
MTKPGAPLTLAERWEIDADLLAEYPLTLDEQPRWIADGLDQYGPDEPAQPTIDDVDPLS